MDVEQPFELMLRSHAVRKTIHDMKREEPFRMVRILRTCSTCGMRNTDAERVCLNKECASERYLISTGDTIQWICGACGNDKNADCDKCTNCSHTMIDSSGEICQEKRFANPVPAVMCKFGWTCHFKKTCPFQHDVCDGKFGSCTSLNCARAHPDRKRFKRDSRHYVCLDRERNQRQMQGMHRYEER